MKFSKKTATKIASLLNSLLVWDRIAQDNGQSGAERTFAMETYNQYADELIALGIECSKYQGV